MVGTNSSFLGTKISSGCNFEIALRLSTHFEPFHNEVRNYKAGVFQVIHLSFPILQVDQGLLLPSNNAVMVHVDHGSLGVRPQF